MLLGPKHGTNKTMTAKVSLLHNGGTYRFGIIVEADAVSIAIINEDVRTSCLLRKRLQSNRSILSVSPLLLPVQRQVFFYGRRKTLSDGYNYRIRFRFDAITTAVRPRYDYSTTYDKQSACSLYPASGVSRVFAARGRSNEMRHPLKKEEKIVTWV